MAPKPTTDRGLPTEILDGLSEIDGVVAVGQLSPYHTVTLYCQGFISVNTVELRKAGVEGHIENVTTDPTYDIGITVRILNIEAVLGGDEE